MQKFITEFFFTSQGIEGETPEKVETSTIRSRIADIHANKSIHLNGTHRICFDPAKQLVFNYFQNLPQHPNGMRFCVYDKQGDLVATNEYFSIGGGFVVNDETQLAHGIPLSCSCSFIAR